MVTVLAEAWAEHHIIPSDPVTAWPYLRDRPQPTVPQPWEKSQGQTPKASQHLLRNALKEIPQDLSQRLRTELGSES